MNPLVAVGIAQALNGLIDIWRVHANKPPEWTPTQADYDQLLIQNEKTAEDYKKEAAAQIAGDPIPADKPEM